VRFVIRKPGFLNPAESLAADFHGSCRAVACRRQILRRNRSPPIQPSVSVSTRISRVHPFTGREKNGMSRLERKVPCPDLRSVSSIAVESWDNY